MKASPVLVLAAALGLGLSCTARQIATNIARNVATNAGIPVEHQNAAEAAVRVGETSFKYARSHQDITPAQEHAIGRTVTARLFQQTPRLEAPAADAYVTRVGLTLAQVSDRPQVYGGYHFAIVDSDTVNAFACPSGFVLVTRGTLDFVQNEDELAAMLAHELSHAARRDPIESIKDVNSIPILTEEMISQAVDDHTGMVSISEAFGESVDGVTETLESEGYDKDYEYAADAMAVEMLARAGYDPRALPGVIARLPAKEGQSATHPKAKDRIKRLEKQMADWAPAAPAPERDARWQAARSELRLARR